MVNQGFGPLQQLNIHVAASGLTPNGAVLSGCLGIRRHPVGWFRPGLHMLPANAPARQRGGSRVLLQASCGVSGLGSLHFTTPRHTNLTDSQPILLGLPGQNDMVTTW